jgi:ribonuclease R
MKKNNNPKTKNQSASRPAKRPRTMVSFVEELKSELATFFEINDERPFSHQEIMDHFDASDERMQLILTGILEELTAEKTIKRTPEGTFLVNPLANQLIGRVEHVNKNYAFVLIEDGSGDVKVDTDNLRDAIDGDLVQVKLFSNSRSPRKREGRVERVLERGRTEFVGIFDQWPNYGVVALDSRRVYENILIPQEKTLNAKPNQKVIVKVVQWPKQGQFMEGEVIEILGNVGDNNAEMHAILAEFKLPYKFPEDVERESEAISTVIEEAEIARRRDMRSVLTFTIDPVDAKDFDDALSVQYLENGNYEIGVHIADVSHYVQPNTALEREAYARATSVYLVDRTVPMLPEKLSNNLCSLRPNEDKLTFSAVFEMTPNAQIVKEWFGRTIIHSDRRFSYEEAQEVIEQITENNEQISLDAGHSTLDAGQPQITNSNPSTQNHKSQTDGRPRTNHKSQTPNYAQTLTLLNGLAHQLRDKRFAQGAINFESVEVKFKLDENGAPIGLYQKIRKDAHKLIEEFMLLANKRVAEFAHGKGNPANTMVYRVHESPDMEKLRTFAAFATKMGYGMKVTDESSVAKSFNDLLSKIEGRPEQNVLEQLAVRTMAKARYSTEDLGHFGLAFRRYSHFTSPIRRYPDVLAHRLLQHYLDKGKSADAMALEAACKHSSEREKLATEAERASIKYKQVEFMSKMDPDRIWDGIITGVTEFGIFVEITETACEGMVRMNDLNDDYYDLDKENYRLVGQRSKKIYAFGGAVKVRVKDINLSRRSIDLELAGTGRSIKNIMSVKTERNRQRNVEKKQRSASAGKRRR